MLILFKRGLPIIAEVPCLLLQIWPRLQKIEVVQDKLVWMIHMQNEAKLSEQISLHVHKLPLESMELLQDQTNLEQASFGLK